MKSYTKNINLKTFFLNIILPTVLTISLFIVLIFSFIVPYFEQNMLNSKKEMISELVNTAIRIAAKYEKEAAGGLITLNEAKLKTISQIENLRYGTDEKDYFWITDFKPVMIMHPYRKDLNNKDLTNFKDPNGKRLFAAMVEKVRLNNEGYVDYMWQWMDDSTSIVPKISYVKSFKPWGWIVGTGIYIEDVREEISAIEQKLLLVLLGISAVMAALLTILVRQNLKSEIKRTQAEIDLNVSREKYKALVEASTEGTGMFLEGQCVFTNKKLKDILQTDSLDYIGNDFKELINPKRSQDYEKIRKFISDDSNYLQIETEIITREQKGLSALFSISKIILSEKNGFIIVVKELSREEEVIQKNRERGSLFFHLSEQAGLGIFTVIPDKKGKFIDANDHAASILGFHSGDELLKISIFELIEDDEEKKRFLNDITTRTILTDYPLHIRRQNGLYGVISLSAVIEHNSDGSVIRIQGIMKDITEQKTLENVREDMYADIQVSLQMMNQQIKNITKNIVSCGVNLPVNKAARLMTNSNADAILIRSENNYVGLITDRDFRERILNTNQDEGRPVSEYMSSPLICINESASITEAVTLMQENRIHHLVVKDSSRTVTGIVSIYDIVQIQHNSSEFLISYIRNSLYTHELISLYKRLPLYIKTIINSGARLHSITKIVTSVNDAISKKVIELVIDELGAPPVDFTFIALGSEGREEQTLLTDQDNAIIYEDVDHYKSIEVKNYFLQFAEKVCCMLDKIGFNYCQGNIMAQNPAWCQPLSVWKKYFTQWITKAEPQDLVDVQIFFDFRCIYGAEGLTQELKKHIDETIKTNTAFLGHMAHGSIAYKIPLTIFGKIQTAEDHVNSLDIKNPIRVLVSLIRLYSVQNNLVETNTIRRLRELYEKKLFSSSFYHDLVYALDFLMLLQFKHQVTLYTSSKKIDNYIVLSELSTIEINTLKFIFSQLSTFQSKIKFDFGISE